MKTPFFCRIGLHRWFLDCAMFNSVDRCDMCGKVRDEWRGERLDRERSLWEEAGELGLPQKEAMWHVVHNLNKDKDIE
jgi:hypothetical protein